MTSKNKQENLLELKEIRETSEIHLTKEENRKIIPKEVKNLRYILSNHSKITKYTWDVDGARVKININK